ncbi:MAG: caspase family protein [Gemmataceae bacterium]
MSLSIDDAGQKLASVDAAGVFRIRNLKERERSLMQKTSEPKIVVAAMAPKGDWCAYATIDGVVRMRTTQKDDKGELRTLKLQGGESPVTHLAWRPDGHMLASIDLTGTVRIFDHEGTAKLGYTLKDIQSVEHLSYSADDKIIVGFRGKTPTMKATTFRVVAYSPKVAKAVGTTLFSDASVSSSERTYIHPNGSALLTAEGGATTLTLLHRGVKRFVHLGPKTGADVLRAKIRNVGISEDGTEIAWGTKIATSTPLLERKGELPLGPLERAFSFATLSLHDNLEEAAFRRAVFHEGDTRFNFTALTTGAQEPLISERKLPKRVPLNPGLGGRPVASTLSFFGPDHAVAGFPNGLHLFELKRYGAKTAGSMLVRKKHTYEPKIPVEEVAVHRERNLVLGTGSDGVFRLWRRDDPQAILQFLVVGKEWVAWTKEGYYACSAGGEKLIRWHVDRGPERIGYVYPAEQFRDRFHRPDVIGRLLGAENLAKAIEAADSAKGVSTIAATIANSLPPTVAVTTNFENGATLASGELSIQANAEVDANRSIDTIRLLIDGRPWVGQDPSFRERSARRQAEWKLRLSPGVHSIAVVAKAEGTEGFSDDVFCTIIPAKAKTLRPTLHILSVGVNDYPANSNLAKLNCAVNDARAIEKAFRDRSKGLFDQVESHVLIDGDATREGILRSLARLEKTVGPDDLTVVFFAGHGERNDQGNFFFMTHDAELAKLKDTALSAQEFQDRIATLPSRRVLILLDACHSGALDASGVVKSKGAVGGQDDLAQRLKRSDVGVVTLCASMRDEKSLESASLGHGFFTLSLVKGLSGAAGVNAEGEIHLSRLCAYVEEQVPELSNDRQHPVVGRPTSVRSFAIARIESRE